MIELGLKVTLAYLVGAVLGSLLVGFLYGGIDIRKLGSGNAGGTNALRTQGKLFALWVMVIDIGKGILAAAVIPQLALPGVGIDSSVDRSLVLYAVAFAAILGHVFPVWFGFRGGKGLGVTGGTIAVLWPPGLLVTLPVLGLVSRAVGSALGSLVGLATMGGAAVVWARRDWAMAWGMAPDDGLVWYAIGVIVLTAPKFLAGVRDRTPTGLSARR
jgi:glycerol-3-phosphate acyltransferase PlsY